MADDPRQNEDGRGLADEEAILSARLQRLGERLGQHPASRQVEAAPRQTAGTSGLARAFRLSSELVGAVLLGAAMGWAIDRWLRISPWGMIVFLLLGFAAGVLNVIRAAGIGPDPSDGRNGGANRP